VVNRTLEGNVSNGYVGYNGSADATASDADGYVYNLRSNLPAKLGLGTTNVTWSATDDDGAVTTVTQSVVVTDTTAPSAPGLSSPTHTTGAWSNNNGIAINGAGVTDACTGLKAFSYIWSSGAPASPDTSADAITTATVTGSVTNTVTVTNTTTVNYQPFATATWPSDWTRSDATYVRLTNTAGRFSDTYAAEAWDNGTTVRALNFYKDYNLSGYTSANLSFWGQVSALTAGDYSRVEYSTNGGTSWTQLQNLTALTAAQKYSFSLPVGGTVRVRFSATVNAAAQYADWDDVAVTGYVTSSTPVVSATATTSVSTTGTMADGTWYFNIRSLDVAGNWSGTTTLGPFYIDTVKPTTMSNAPSGWSTSAVNVSLVATDPSGPVAYTRYKLDAAAIATYTVPVAVSGDGTHTLLFFSADMAGNVEATKSATIQIDSTLPSVPTSIGASALSTTSIQVTWAPAVDTGSGVAYYAVYRDGSLAGTVTAGPYTDTGLSPGSTHTYYVVAVDGAQNRSANSTTATATTPSAAIWMSLSTDTVDLGGVQPGLASTLTSATTVKVGGIGGLTYDFWCSATDFSNGATASVTPTMPVSALSYVTNGQISAGLQPFTTTPYKLDTSTGVPYVWEHDYRFDYVLNAPWAFDPGTYTTTVLYTVVSH